MVLSLRTLQLLADDHDISDRELDLDDGGDLSSQPWTDSMPSPVPSSSRSASIPVPPRAERSGQDTPASVDSIPLEWDHDYDLSRSLEAAGTQAPASDPGPQLPEEDFGLLGAASGLSSQFPLSSCQKTCCVSWQEVHATFSAVSAELPLSQGIYR